MAFLKIVCCAIISFISVRFAICKVEPFIHDELEICATKEEQAGYFDFSEMELIAVNDTHVYINGKWKFLKEVRKPWQCHIYMERFDRGRWIVNVFNRKYEDFCKVIQDPTQPWFQQTRKWKHKHCPFPKGVRYHSAIDRIPFI